MNTFYGQRDESSNHFIGLPGELSCGEQPGKMVSLVLYIL